MLTQPSRLRINGNPPCSVDIQDRPYMLRTIKNELFEVVFLNKENFYENINPIIENAKITISDCLIEEKFRYNIFVELFQNIHKHPASNKETKDWFSSSKFALKKEDSQYTIELSNLCELEDFNKLLTFLKINEMSCEDMKEAYKKQVLEGKMSEKGGAGLGFLTILRSIKNHHKDENIKLIDIKKLGTVKKAKIDNKGETSFIDLINAKITINIPFFKKNDKKNITNDHRTDDQTSLHKSA